MRILEIKINTIKTYKYAKVFINAYYYEQFNFTSSETRWR